MRLVLCADLSFDTHVLIVSEVDTPCVSLDHFVLQPLIQTIPLVGRVPGFLPSPIDLAVVHTDDGTHENRLERKGWCHDHVPEIIELHDPEPAYPCSLEDPEECVFFPEWNGHEPCLLLTGQLALEPTEQCLDLLTGVHPDLL